jgi:inhibitor of cysteine peptidase
MKRKMVFYLLITALLLLISSTPFLTSANDSMNEDGEKMEQLPLVGSYQKLLSLMKEIQDTKQTMHLSYDTVEETALEGSQAEAKSFGNASRDTKTENDYSTTNVQVQGVDEADVIKTDGEYIYQVNEGRVVIAKAYPADEMEIVNTLQFDEKTTQLHEIYIDEKHLVVIASSYLDAMIHEQKDANKEILPRYHRTHSVKAMIYDIQDKTNIALLREVELEGNYISSRKIDSSLYLISNKYLDVHYILKNNEEYPAPSYLDSTVSEKSKLIDYKDIHYFPDSLEPNYLMIGGLDLNDLEKEMDVSTYLGTGEHLYASKDHLYVTVTQHEKEKKTRPFFSSERSYTPKNSAIYKFKLAQGDVQFMTQGEVPGTILNQFSMDEHNGFFRIATTTGEMWREDEHTSKNNLYILDQELKLTGKIEDIAPGERIYSVRFMGDRGYMVTFKTVDPLFVIGLEDPAAPSILGKLKIPGYSDYLHPYDENHLIGFGKDTIEYAQGKGNPNMAYYQGMKMALFDVTDVSNPKEKFVEIIGDRGTDSELLYNHKALLFSKEKNLLAFPIKVMKIDEKHESDENIMQYGEFTFQGAYIYGLDLEQGFTLQKRITHISDEEYLKAGQHWYESHNNVERILYIGDTLYTLSKGMIKAHELDSFEERNQLHIPHY